MILLWYLKVETLLPTWWTCMQWVLWQVRTPTRVLHPFNRIWFQLSNLFPAFFMETLIIWSFFSTICCKLIKHIQQLSALSPHPHPPHLFAYCSHYNRQWFWANFKDQPLSLERTGKWSQTGNQSDQGFPTTAHQYIRYQRGTEPVSW